MKKHLTPQELVKLDDRSLNQYFGRLARYLSQAGKEPYYVVLGTVTLWAKTPKLLYPKFKAEVKRQAKLPPRKPERTLVTMLILPVAEVGDALRNRLADKKGKKTKIWQALERFSCDLAAAAKVARYVGTYLADKNDVEIDADATIIQITGPESVLRPLVRSKHLWVDQDGTREWNAAK